MNRVAVSVPLYDATPAPVTPAGFDHAVLVGTPIGTVREIRDVQSGGSCSLRICTPVSGSITGSVFRLPNQFQVGAAYIPSAPGSCNGAAKSSIGPKGTVSVTTGSISDPPQSLIRTQCDVAACRL